MRICESGSGSSAGDGVLCGGTLRLRNSTHQPAATAKATSSTLNKSSSRLTFNGSAAVAFGIGSSLRFGEYSVTGGPAALATRAASRAFSARSEDRGRPTACARRSTDGPATRACEFSRGAVTTNEDHAPLLDAPKNSVGKAGKSVVQTILSSSNAVTA